VKNALRRFCGISVCAEMTRDIPCDNRAGFASSMRGQQIKIGIELKEERRYNTSETNQ